MATRLAPILALAALAGPLAAQQPLSVIDWLSQNPPADAIPARPSEPPVARTALTPEISVAPLGEAPVAVGLVPASVTGLPVTLWTGSDPQVLAQLLATAPVANSPAMRTLLYTLILTEAVEPGRAPTQETLLLARIDRLMAEGAADPAQALVEQAGPGDTPQRFQRWFEISLLTGTEAEACAALVENPRLAPSLAAQIFCTARDGALSAATVMFDGGNALDLMQPDDAAALDRFLHPEVFEDAPPPAPPGRADPLLFRLHEAIGAPLPTAGLPRLFANADLRDIAGWRAQLEAAERLARAGAVTPNTLLGLYTARRPAASGGIWDRVAAIQRFETALATGSADAIAKTLPRAYAAMHAAGNEVAFAELFSRELAALELTEPSLRQQVYRIALLSPDYETAARLPPDQSDESRFLAALARGEPAAAPDGGPLSAAIRTGFARAALPAGMTTERLGETILRLMVLFDRGARGNPQALSDALSGLRALGLEDTARRAALQLLLLERG